MMSKRNDTLGGLVAVLVVLGIGITLGYYLSPVQTVLVRIPVNIEDRVSNSLEDYQKIQSCIYNNPEADASVVLQCVRVSIGVTK